MSDVPDLTGHRTVLEELRREFDKLFAAADVLDGKSQNLFAATGILISIAAIWQASWLKPPRSLVFFLAAGFVVLLYVILVVFIFVALRPRSFKLPMSLDWDEQAYSYFGEEEVKVLERLISNYIEVIQVIRGILDAKSRALNCAMVLFLVIVALLLAGLALSA